MRKELNRRSFLVGCGLLTFSSAGIFFTGCGGKKDDDGDNDLENEHENDDNDKNIDEHKVAIENKDKTITISANDLEVLKSRAYLEVSSENLLVFYYDNKFYGYSNICPHQSGILKIENKTTIRCTKHNSQTYDNNGKTNRARTSKSLSLITLDIKTS